MDKAKTTKHLKTVLLIDDESPWLELMNIALEGESFKVLTAEGGTQALKLLKRHKPDLILSDVRMPVINGFDLYQIIRNNPKYKSIPYVFMSVIDDYDAQRTAKQLGADDYIVKPFDTKDARTIIINLFTKFQNTK